MGNIGFSAALQPQPGRHRRHHAAARPTPPACRRAASSHPHHGPPLLPPLVSISGPRRHRRYLQASGCAGCLATPTAPPPPLRHAADGFSRPPLRPSAAAWFPPLRQGSLSGRWPAVAIVRLPPLVPRSPPPALAAVAAAWLQRPLTGRNPSARILVNVPWRLEAEVADGGRRATEVATSVALHDGGAGGKLALEHFMLWQSGAVYRGCIDKLLEASGWNTAWGRLM